MAIALYRYEFDPTGASKDNLVIGEMKTIQYGKDFGVVIPTQAPFYSENLVVRSLTTSELLIEGIDYFLVGLNKEISSKTGLSTVLMILKKCIKG